jgi:biopolymer transport protein ExbB/TolQ
MIIETSKDILYIVLAFCVLWLTIFMSWLLYYFIGMARNAYRLVQGFSNTIKKTDELIKTLKEKIEHSASYFVVAAEALKEVVKYVIEKRRESQDNKEEVKKRKKEKEEIN